MKNKKFIYITNSRVPTEKANGLQIIQNCEALANAGLELELWIPQRKNTKKLSLIKNYWHYYGVKKNFIIKKFYCIDFLAYFQIEFFSRISYFLQYSTFLASVFFYLIGRTANYFYSRDYLISFFVAFLKPRSTTVFECHSIPSSILSQCIFKISLKKINYIIALTDPISSTLINLGISKSKILTAHDGFRMNRFLDLPSKNSVKRLINIDKSTFVVGYLGRFTTLNLDKGIETLIDAMVGIPNSVLVLIGGPKEYFKLYEKYWSLKNLDRKNLIFINNLPPKLVTKYITCFDVGVIPLPYNKHFAYYSSPLKLFEYMASGIPVVASKFEAWKDVLNSNNSFSFQSSNAKQLKKILLYIKRNPTIAKQKAIIGKKLVLKEYTWDKRAMKILNFINIA